MKLRNNLLIPALATALIAPKILAEDSHQVYGQVNISMDHTSVSGSGLTAKQKSGEDSLVGRDKGLGFNSNSSRFGLKGTMQTNLSDFTLDYRAEMQYDTVGDAESENIKGREATVGLNSKTKGFIRMGRLTSFYKSSYSAVDPWTDHLLQARAAGEQGASNLNSNYFNNAIEYRSPRINGFQLGAFYSAMHDKSQQKLHNSGKLSEYRGGSASGIGIHFAQNGLLLALDSITLNADKDVSKAEGENPDFGESSNPKNGTAIKLTAEYQVNALSFGGHYEDVSDLHLGTNVFVVAGYKTGNAFFTLTGGVNQGDDKKNVYGKKDSTAISLGFKYQLNKTSSLIAGYSHYSRPSDKGDNRTANTVTFGIDSKFGY